MNFFKESKMPTYQKMWEFMSGPMKEEVMVSGNGEGIEKVVNDDGGYAFMMESSSIQVLPCSDVLSSVFVAFSAPFNA